MLDSLVKIILFLFFCQLKFENGKASLISGIIEILLEDMRKKI